MATIDSDAQIARQLQDEEDAHRAPPIAPFPIPLPRARRARVSPRGVGLGRRVANTRRRRREDDDEDYIPYNEDMDDNNFFGIGMPNFMANIIAAVSAGVGQPRMHIPEFSNVDPRIREMMGRDLTANDYAELLELDERKANDAASSTEIESLPVFQYSKSKGKDKNATASSSSSSSSSGSSSSIGSNSGNVIDLVDDTPIKRPFKKKKLEMKEDDKGVIDLCDVSSQTPDADSSVDVDADVDVDKEAKKDEKYQNDDEEDDDDDEGDKCCICLGMFESGDELMRLPCFHTFHSDCGKNWLKVKASCPICNEWIDSRPQFK